jgi:nucleotidyltransferase/DNA polymerase involved in DNA repair
MRADAIPRVILHLDMDAFYAAVEIRENPSLAGKPLIIGHRGRRGVVSTCSYEARTYGVRSAMPSVTAERLCPDAVWLSGRMRLYVQVSRQIRKILDDVAPVVEPLSIDEAFLDMTGAVADLEGGRRIAVDLKERMVRSQRLTASVGVAPNKFLAKIASDMDKPDGLVVFPVEDVPKRLWPMPIRRLWGVGPKTGERLEKASILTIGDLLKVPSATLESLVGRNGSDHLRALARGEDHRPVHRHHEAKSISEERTYREDLTDPDDIDRALLARSEGIAWELRRKKLQARTVHIKVRTGDFTTWTRSLTLSDPTDLAEGIVRAARDLYRERIRLKGRGVRLLGVGVSGLETAGSGQHALFVTPDEERARRMTRAADAVRERLGEDAVTRARLLRRRKGDEDEEPPEASSLPSVD